MSVLDIAGSARRASASFVTLSTLDNFPQYLDSDDYTRALAVRDSDDAPMVVYVRGSVADVISVHNERSRLTHERNNAQKRADDETLSAPDRETQRAIVAERDEQLSKLPKTRAIPTLHVARALAHYESLSD